MKNEIALLYVPCPDAKIVRKISLKLLQSKAAACLQSSPTNSMYPWKGKSEQAKELILIVKTLPKKSNVAKSIIKENHSYDIPCIMQFKARVNKEYYNWMKEVMG